MRHWIGKAVVALCVVSSGVLTAEEEVVMDPSEYVARQDLRIGFANFKTCAESSKVGQREQERFESLKKDLEKKLEEKEKAIAAMAEKFNDEYLDSISPEAEADLRQQFRSMTQEMQQMNQQYYQTLQQANYKMMSEISEMVAEASSRIARKKGLDAVINDEACFFFGIHLDITRSVVQMMDEVYDEASKEGKAK